MKTATNIASFLPQTGKNVIIFQDLDFGFEKWELNQIVKDWNEGKELEEIAEELQRKGLEILMALIHSARKGRITRSFARRMP